MPSEQFSQAVRGSGGDPIRTNASGVIETDNYDEGGVIDGSAYPFTVNPASTIQEVVITTVGSEIEVDIHTVSGTVLQNVPLNGRLMSLDTIEIDKLVFLDPAGTGDATQGFWVGE